MYICVYVFRCSSCVKVLVITLATVLFKYYHILPGHDKGGVYTTGQLGKQSQLAKYYLVFVFSTEI